MEEIWSSLEFWVGIAHWLTGLGTVILAVAIFKTFRHLEASTKLSKIESEYRLRPWVGPSTGIKRMDNSINGKIQFSITVKNFGDLPASGDNDLWGTTLTPAQINTDDFSIAIDSGTGGGNRYLDNVKITINYETNFNSEIPDTIITSSTVSPSAITSLTSNSISFSASITSTFQCSFDGSSFSACSSPVTYSSLSDGLHIFTVKAIAGTNEDPTPASVSWTVDTIPLIL